MLPPPLMDEDVDVAIIGSGPAGIAAALALRARGVGRVLVLEREAEPGGVPRHCAHPPYGLREFGRIMTGPAYARRLVERARAAGVEIRTLTTVVRLLPGGGLDLATPDGRQQLQARRVIIATGVRETPRSARLIGGDRPLGVINTGALQANIHLHGMAPFQRPLVVGTELVSLSAIATCRAHGIRPVAVIEENARPTARWPLSLFPRLAGIPLHLNTTLASIHGTIRVDSVSIAGPGGGILREIACDGVLLTGRFLPEAALIRVSHLALDKGSQGPAIDQFGRCSDPSYFAAGNVLRAVETAGWSFREGRRIGAAVADDLAGRLPAPVREAAILCGAGVKLVVPQRFATPAAPGGTDHLELRVTTAVRGRLRVIAEDRVVFEKTLTALPERRILIPLRHLSAHAAARHFVVEVKA
jgi:thioredoxin reductase